ncbi:NADH:flavin oxidoreductase [Candidatus Woesearchaeota archaeon]|nr:NADH:flavin oxidoreductase [Candidatus Woesearchaeota archaeon]
MGNELWNQPTKLGKYELKNKIVYPPIGRSWGDLNGNITNRVYSCYKNLAEGGCGMIVVEGTTVSPDGKGSKRTLGLYNQTHLDGLKKISNVIKQNKCLASIQLLHAGGQANPIFTGYEPKSPSKMDKTMTGTGYASRELTVEEIKEILNHFVDSALLADKAGFQAVELHLAHGYLLHEFLSEHTNKRNDNYGGNLENRMRLITEIISEIKKNSNILIGVRISGEDYIPDGINKKVNKEILPILEKVGVEYFSVTAGIYETSKIKHLALKEGKFFEYSKDIKKMINKPVISVGKILDLNQAEKHLQNEDCDLVAIGRGLIADPHMINKFMKGENYNFCLECDGCRYLAMGKESLECPFDEDLENRLE